jgi:hypothetical protein
MDNANIIELKAKEAIELQSKVADQVAKLKETQDKINAEWDKVEELMIKYDLKQVKGEWGTLTIAERTGFDIDKELLPPRFFKRVPDETKIRTIYQLEGKAPKGTSPKVTNYLVKRLK